MSLLLAALSLSLLAATPQSNQADVPPSMERVAVLLEQQEYAAAIELLTPVAEKNYAPALTMLGRLYAEGKGTTTDANRAYDLFLKADDFGDAAAALEIAKLSQSHPRSAIAPPFYWLKRGMMGGHLAAGEELARYYLGEWGEEFKDDEKAALALADAAMYRSQWALSKIHELSATQIPARVEKAWQILRGPQTHASIPNLLEWLKELSKAYEYEQEASFVLGWHTYHHSEYPADARHIFRKGVTDGSTRAKTAMVLYFPDEYNFKSEITQAQMLEELAADGELYAWYMLQQMARRDVQALASVGRVVSKYGLLYNFERGASLLKAALENGAQQVLFDLGRTYAIRARDKNNPDLARTALDNLRRAQQMGDVEAGLFLGQWLAMHEPALPDGLHGAEEFGWHAGVQALRWAYAQPYQVPDYALYAKDSTFGDPRAAVEIGYALIRGGQVRNGSYWLRQYMKGHTDQASGELLRKRMGQLEKAAAQGDVEAQVAIWLFGRIDNNRFGTLKEDAATRNGRMQELLSEGNAVAVAANQYQQSIESGAQGFDLGELSATELFHHWSDGIEAARGELLARENDANARLALAMGPNLLAIRNEPNQATAEALVDAPAGQLFDLALGRIESLAEQGNAKAQFVMLWLRASDSPLLRNPEDAYARFQSVIRDERLTFVERAWVRAHLVMVLPEYGEQLADSGEEIESQFHAHVATMIEKDQLARAVAALIFTGPRLFPDRYHFAKGLATAKDMFRQKIPELNVAYQVTSAAEGVKAPDFGVPPAPVEMLFDSDEWQSLDNRFASMVHLRIREWDTDIVETVENTTVTREVTETVTSSNDPKAEWKAEMRRLDDIILNGRAQIAYWEDQASNPLLDQRELGFSGFYDALRDLRDEVRWAENQLYHLYRGGPKKAVTSQVQLKRKKNVPASDITFSGTLGLTGSFTVKPGVDDFTIRVPWRGGFQTRRVEGEDDNYGFVRWGLPERLIREEGQRVVDAFLPLARQNFTRHVMQSRRWLVENWYWQDSKTDGWSDLEKESERAWRRFWFVHPLALSSPLLAKEEGLINMPFVEFETVSL